MRLVVGLIIGVALGMVYHRQIREYCAQCLQYLEEQDKKEPQEPQEQREDN